MERSLGPSRLDTHMVITERRLLVPREKIDPRFIYKPPKDQALVSLGVSGAASSDNAFKAVVDTRGRYFGVGEAGRQRQIEHAQKVMENNGPVERVHFSGGPVGNGVGDHLFYRYASRDNRMAHADPEARPRARAAMRTELAAEAAEPRATTATRRDDGGDATARRSRTLQAQAAAPRSERREDSTREMMTARPLPQGWLKVESRSRPGVGYYYDRATSTSQWRRPPTAPAPPPGPAVGVDH